MGLSTDLPDNIDHLYFATEKIFQCFKWYFNNISFIYFSYLKNFWCHVISFYIMVSTTMEMVSCPLRTSFNICVLFWRLPFQCVNLFLSNIIWWSLSHGIREEVSPLTLIPIFFDTIECCCYAPCPIPSFVAGSGTSSVESTEMNSIKALFVKSLNMPVRQSFIF